MILVWDRKRMNVTRYSVEDHLIGWWESDVKLILSLGDKRSDVRESIRGRSDEAFALHFCGVGRPSWASGPRQIGRPMGWKSTFTPPSDLLRSVQVGRVVNINSCLTACRDGICWCQAIIPQVWLWVMKPGYYFRCVSPFRLNLLITINVNGQLLSTCHHRLKSKILDSIAKPWDCFRMVHGLPHRVGAAWMDLPFLSWRLKSSERENEKDAQTWNWIWVPWAQDEYTTHSVTAFSFVCPL